MNQSRSDRNDGNNQTLRENALNILTTSDSVACETEADCFDKLQNLRLKYPKNVIFGYININSIRNKLENFSMMIQDHIDILVIAETKLDASFPNNQFLIPGFKTPYRLDVSEKSGGLLSLSETASFQQRLKLTICQQIYRLFRLNSILESKNGCYYRSIDLQIKVCLSS